MTISSLHHMQGIRGYKLKKTERTPNSEIYHLYSTDIQAPCPKCESYDTKLIKTGCVRNIAGLSIGKKRTIMRVETRRISCKSCGSSCQEPIKFVPRAYVGYTKWCANYVLDLRREMSITAVARFTGLNWETVKNIEKHHLKKVYKKICLSNVQYMGIDEVYMGKVLGYITVVRDLDSGAVLYVGKGKGSDSLVSFSKRIKRYKNNIKAVAIDMANSYTSWVHDVLPGADIVYDHFHVIKLMNDHMNSLRKSTMNKLEDDQKKELKGQRFLLLMNQENLSVKGLCSLSSIRETFKDLGTASFMKEYLRNIYKLADTSSLAERAFIRWCEKAEESGVACLKRMANTIRKRIKGLISFWDHKRLTSASQEGFNNKIGWLTRQAYGYRDEEYLHLKIYDLPHLSLKSRL